LGHRCGDRSGWRIAPLAAQAQAARALCARAID